MVVRMKTTTSLIARALLIAFVGCHGIPSAAPLPPPPACPTTPPELAPPPGTEVAFALLVDANGVQRYSCTPSGWSAAIPAAALFTIGGDARQVIAHFAGPEWMATDGSSVVAAKRAGVTVDDTAIQWLDLEVTSHNGTPGLLAPITWIQRLSTRGGISPPVDECNAASIGTERDVKYSAEYRFYRASPPGSAGIRCGS